MEEVPPRFPAVWEFAPIYSDSSSPQEKDFAFSLPATPHQLQLLNELKQRFNFETEEAELIILQRRFERGQVYLGSLEQNNKILAWFSKTSFFAKNWTEMQNVKEAGGDMTKFTKVDPVVGRSLLQIMHSVRDLCTSSCQTYAEVFQCQDRACSDRFRYVVLGYGE